MATKAFLCALGAFSAGCGDSGAPVQLIVSRADVLDVRSGQVMTDRTIVVDDGRILDLLSPEEKPPAAATVLDGSGRLIVPGFVDAHSHFAYLLGDSLSTGGGLITRLSSDPDSIPGYRRRYARQYLPYGVTTVRDAGSSEADLRLMLRWISSPGPDLPDIHPAGGALVSHEDGRTPFPGHRVVDGPAEAAAAVRDYHETGLDQIKLYWRLREPEFRTAMEEARRLEMNVTGHIDFHVLDIDRALDLGLRSFEHAYTLGVSALGQDGYLAAWRESLPRSIGDRQRGRFYLGVMEYFNVLGPDDPRMNDLIRRLARTDSFVVPTLHLFAGRLGLTAFDLPSLGEFDDLSGLTPEQLERARDGYRILAGYVRRMQEEGVLLAVGTDTPEPGRAVLSEIRLLHEAGIPMTDALRIATLGGAVALGIADDVGAIEPGRKAHLVIFDQDPLEEPDGLFGPRTVVKHGVVLR